MTMRGHTSLMTRNKLMSLGWEVVIHPMYSPDIAPPDYHLFRALQNFVDGKKLAYLDATENHLAKFFTNEAKNKDAIKYPNLKSAMRPIPHNDNDLPHRIFCIFYFSRRNFRQ